MLMNARETSRIVSKSATITSEAIRATVIPDTLLTTDMATFAQVGPIYFRTVQFLITADINEIERLGTTAQIWPLHVYLMFI